MESDGKVKWRDKATTFLGVQFTNRTWAILISAILWMLGFAVLVLANSASNPMNFWFIAIGVPGALVGLGLALRLALPSGRFLVFLSLGLLAASLALEAYLLGSPFFSPFSVATKLTLWVVLGVLASAAFIETMPPLAIAILSPCLVFGALVTVPYAIRIAPLMAFGWMAIPFAGIGLLVYTPVIAMAAFARCWSVGWQRVCQRGTRFEVRSTAILSATAIVAFFAIVFTVRHSIVSTDENGRSRLKQMSSPYSSMKDLPAWLLLSGGAEPNLSVRYLVGEFDSGWILDDTRGAVFDIFVHAASLGLVPWPLWSMAGDTWGRLAADGKLSLDLRSLRVEDTTYVNHAGIRVQVFPDQYVAYTEVDLQIESSFARESVANMLLEIPSGSVASSLTLWIDGQERPARFALRGKASQAFNTIVNKKRDPALIEWIDDRHLRLQVFPVSHVLPRRVKLGYVTPLDNQELELEYRSPTISGIRQDTASAFVTVEVFSEPQPQALASNLDFKPLGVAAGAAKPFEAQTSLTKPWSVKVAAPGEKAVHEPSTWSPEAIVFVPRGGRSEAQWNDARSALQAAFPNATIGAFGDRLNWLTYSKDLARSVEDGRTMRGLPLPFYQRDMPNPSTTLYVVENDRAPNILTLRGTDYFRSMSSFFVNHGEGLRILGLDEAISPFYWGLSELDLATVLSFDGKRLLQVPSLISNVRGEKMATEFVDRLVAYKQSMRHAILDEVRGDGTPDSLADEMRKGHLVTPFSSLIVLESEGDYSRFGINDKDSEKNNTRPADPSLRESLGLVPEPHEYLLLAICLAAIAYLYRRRSGAVLG